MKTKIALVVGHNSRAQGANRVDGGGSEYTWNTELAEMTEDILDSEGFDCRIFWRQDMGSYSKEIDHVYRRVDQWRARIVLEYHFNAASPEANGCEMLHAGSPEGARLALAVQEAILEDHDVQNRGIKQLSKGSRGSGSVFASVAPTIITEPYFGSSHKDCAKFSNKQQKQALAKSIAKGIMRYLKA